MKTKQITLSGFGTFDENEQDLLALKKAAKKHKVEFYATYYDHELKGDKVEIEAITEELWSMSSDEWADNALTETTEEVKCICLHCGNEHMTPSDSQL